MCPNGQHCGLCIEDEMTNCCVCHEPLTAPIEPLSLDDGSEENL